MDIGFSSAVSGLQAVSLRQDVVAHNIANVNTPGFEESRTNQVDTKPYGVRVGSITKIPNSDPTISGTDLTEQQVNQLENKNMFSADAKVIKARDSMIGTLLDMIA